MHRWLIFAALALSFGCGASQEEPQMADPDDPAYAASFDGEVDPRVSRSAGEPGGYVVLWPRIVPADDPDGSIAAVAAAIQGRLVAMATQAAGGRPVDVRPEPERVCPSRGGCEAGAVGAVLIHQGGGCAVVATASLPGETPQQLQVWAGGVDVINASPAFREPPEQAVRVDDLVPCDALGPALDERAEDVARLVLSARHDPI